MNEQFAFMPAGLATAFALGLIMTGLAAWIGRGRESPSSPRWGAALGLGLGYILAHATIREWLTGPRLADARTAFRSWTAEEGAVPFLPGVVMDWLPWLAVAALILGLFDGARPVPSWARWENRLLLTSVTIWLLLGPLVSNGTWTPGQGTRWISAIGAGMLAFWAVLDARAERLGAAMPLPLLLMATAAALSLGHSDFYLYVLPGSLAAGLGAIWLVSWADRRLALSRATIPVFATVFAGLILVGYFYNDVPWPTALGLAMSPLATYVDRIGPVSRLSPWKVAAIRVAALLIPLITAVGVAFAMKPPEVDTGGY